VAAGFTIAMAFSTAPTPLWPLYQATDRFETWMITVAFAVYAVGVVASLLLVGHVSDWVGRRRMLLPALLLEALSAAIFVCYPQLPGLLAARSVSGLGIGMLTATATAHLGELHRVAHPRAGAARTGQLVTAANLGGLAIGPMLAGVLARYTSGPLSTVYLIFLGLLLLCAAAVALAPETVTVPAIRPGYRPQRVAVPASARGDYLVVALAAFAAFAMLGLVTSLASKILAVTLGVSSPAVSGIVCSVVLGGSVLAQLLPGPRSPLGQLTLGSGALALGVVLLAAAAPVESFPLFLAGGLLGGAGAGVLFKGAMQTAAALADPTNRGEVIAGVFVAAYLGLIVPVVGLGVAAQFVPLTVALIGFAALIVAILGTVLLLLRVAPRPQKVAPRP
jgi:hypothetical protein